MPKFSVKKPFTVLVAVIAILVLGVVAYFRMTPDLMPNMDLPYVIVMTTYPGATPEEVETTISKPLEQVFSTLENINSVSSTSSENYSMVTLEFTDDVNMDTVSVDILQNINQVSGYWDDTVGTPYILKLNPSMIPVAVTAVSKEGMDNQELSTFVDEEILPKLEGIDGVASIESSGLLTTKVNVVLNQDKIDAVNETIKASLDDKFADAKEELDEGQDKIDSGKAEIASGKNQLADGKNQMAAQMGEAQAKISSGSSELLETKIQLKAKLEELQTKRAELVKNKETLTNLQSSISQAEEAKTQLESAIAGLNTLKSSLSQLQMAQSAFDAQIAQIQADTTLSDDEKTAAIAAITGSEPYLQTQAGLATVDANLTALGTDRGGIDTAIATYQAQLDQVNAGLTQIDSSLAAQNMTRGDVAASLKELESGLTQIDGGIAQINNAFAQIEMGGAQLNQAQKTLEEQKTLAIFQLSETTTQLLLGESQLEAASTSMEDGVKQYEDGKEAAYKQADLDNIVTMDMVSNILMAQNFSMPAGYVEEDGIQYMVSVGDELTDDEEMKNLLLLDLDMDGVDPIYLSDVADVFISDNSDEVYANIDGENGVMLSFSKQSTYATATVSNNIKTELEALEDEYEGFHYSTMMDQGDYIYMIINSILQSLLLGAVFAVIILYLFLRDIKPTFITLCSIPISVIFAIVLMYFSGITLNMISLSGLAVAVGMLVDNSVVVIENTYRLINKGENAVKAAVHGAGQVAGAIASSTLTTICVFVPIVFVQGLTRELFTDMALTMAYALLASLIIALTLVPAMSSALLKNVKDKKHPLMDKIMPVYERLLGVALKHKAIALLLALGMLVLSVGITLVRGFIFMPEMSTNQMSATISVSENSTLTDLAEVSDKVIADVQKMDGVVSVGAMAQGESNGMASIMGGGSEGLSSTLYIMLEETGKIDNTALTEKINALGEKYDCTVDASGSGMSSMTSMMGGSGITIYLFGDNLDDLQVTAKEVAKVLEDVDGTIEVSDGLEEADPAIKVTVDKEKAMKKGLTVAQVYQELSGALTSEKNATALEMNGSSYDVYVQKADVDGGVTPDDIRKYSFTVTGQDGEEKTVNLKDIADITETESLQSITRMDQKRYISISCELEDGYNVSLVTADAKEALKKYDLPTGMSLKFDGSNEAIMDSMTDLVKMLLLGMVLVYLVMVAQFQSLKSPFIVMFTIPLAFTGGFLGLFICGMELSVISMIGFVMLCGIIVNNGIVLVDYVNQLRAEGVNKTEALIEAGKTRMRPIFMTTITTILGLIVMALGIGSGNDMMQPIAIVCIGGLAYATIMTLFIIPVLYDIMNRKELHVIRGEDLKLEEE